MKKPEQVFVKTPEQPDLPEEKMITRYLRQEMKDDLDAFPGHLQALILKRINGYGLDAIELAEYKEARNSWWERKYGFPYGLRASRNEVLLRKYGSPALEQIHPLQSEYFQAVAAGAESEIEDLKQRYGESFPDRVESIEVLFAFREMMLLEKKVRLAEQADLNQRERMEIFESLTEYQFLFTHFIIENSEDKAGLEAFWDTLHQIAKRIGLINEFNAFRRGQVSQAAVYKIMERLDLHPKLSHPREDAFKAVDLWSENDSSLQALQIKGWNEEVPAVIKAKEVSYPAVETEDDEGIRLFNASNHRRLQKKNKQFFAKVDRLNAERKKNGLREVSGYLLVVPYSKIDFVTGEPDPAMVEFFRDKVGKNPISEASA